MQSPVESQSLKAVAAALLAVAGVLTYGLGLSATTRWRTNHGLAGYTFGNATSPDAFALRIASSRAGLTFNSDEPLDVRVRVVNAPGPTTLEYSIVDIGNSWNTTGQLTFERDERERVLPLTLPTRGLFKSAVATSNGRTARVTTSIAVVFQALQPEVDSPWGMLAVPQDYRAAQVEDVARSKRRLGAAWARVAFPYPGLDGTKIRAAGTGAATTFSINLTEEMRYVNAMRREGLSILADLTQVPRALSSMPDDTSQVGDSAPGFANVPPRDYEAWKAFVTAVVTQYRGLVQVWQVGNEPELPGKYWRGTPEQFVELAEHTATAIKQADPAARVAAPGVHARGLHYADRLFDLGLGKHIDVFTVHYTDEGPDSVQAAKQILSKHGLNLPIWNSEEKPAIPLNNLIGGQGPFMKFLHVDLDGYADFANLVRPDLTVLPAGIAFSVGAHCLGDARWTHSSDKLGPSWRVDFFGRGQERIGVFRRTTTPPQLFEPAVVGTVLDLTPLTPEQPITATDIWGHSRTLTVADGRAVLRLDEDLIFVNGARLLDIGTLETTPARAALVVEAESGTWSPGWAVSNHKGYSSGRLLEIWSSDDPSADGFWVSLDFTVPRDASYDLVFAGTSLDLLRPGNRGLSPFVWSVDEGVEHRVESPLRSETNIVGAPQGVSVLGTQNLQAGRHTFRLKLLARNDPPARRWAMWFDALALVAKPR